MRGAPPPSNYRCSRLRPQGQRLCAAGEINWRRQLGLGAVHDPKPKPGTQRPPVGSAIRGGGRGCTRRRLPERGEGCTDGTGHVFTLLLSTGSCHSHPLCCHPRMPPTSPWALISDHHFLGCPQLCVRPQVRNRRVLSPLCRCRALFRCRGSSKNGLFFSPRLQLPALCPD